MLKRVLLYQIVFALFGVFITLSSASLIFFYIDSKNIVDTNLKHNLDHTLRFIQKAYKLPLWNFDKREIFELSIGLLQQDMIVAVNVNNEYEFFTSVIKDDYKLKKSIHSTKIVNQPFFIKSELKDIEKVDLDILFDNRVIGSLEIFYTNHFSFEEIKSRAKQLTYVLLLYTFLTISIIYYIISKKVLKPVLTLAKFTVEVAETHNFSLRAKYDKKNEIQSMYNGFNYLLSSILKREKERDLLDFELNRTRNYLKNVLQAMSSIMFAVDDKFIIKFWNKAAADHTGLNEEDVIEKSFSLIEARFNFLKPYIKKVFTNLNTINMHRQVLEEQQFVDIYLYPLMFENEVSVVIRIDDVTELERKESQLVQAQKMETVGTLAGGLAHDFNNILNGIVGTLSIIKHKISNEIVIESDKMKSYLDILDNSSNRATDLVQQLLSLSRKQDIDFKPVDLNVAIKNVLKICQNSFDKKVVIKATFSIKKAIIFGSLSHLEQILLNLCINAYHAMTIMRTEKQSKEGVLSIALDFIKNDRVFATQHTEAKEDYYWKVQVGDTGIGMSQSLISKIFEPFFTTKGKDKGTGLGLTMVYNIVKEHRGFIDVYSEVNYGTTFHIYFPVYSDSEITYDKNVPDTIFKDSGLVLVIDDEPLVRNTLKEMLEICGYKVETAIDGDDGVSRYFDLKDKLKFVILDMIMPKKSGKEVYQILKKDNPGLKVIIASGFKQDERVEQVIKAGVAAFIQKPFTLDKLIRTIKFVFNM